MSMEYLRLFEKNQEATEIIQTTFHLFVIFWFQFSVCDF